ncbi:hypothetical protein BST61_g8252 [Cercospora zeina]
MDKLTRDGDNDFAAVMEAAFARHDHGVDCTKIVELDQHRNAVERLLFVDKVVVEPTDHQPASFFELAFDGE